MTEFQIFTTILNSASTKHGYDKVLTISHLLNIAKMATRVYNEDKNIIMADSQINHKDKQALDNAEMMHEVPELDYLIKLRQQYAFYNHIDMVKILNNMICQLLGIPI